MLVTGKSFNVLSSISAEWENLDPGDNLKEKCGQVYQRSTAQRKRRNLNTSKLGTKFGLVCFFSLLTVWEDLGKNQSCILNFLTLTVYHIMATISPVYIKYEYMHLWLFVQNIKVLTLKLCFLVEMASAWTNLFDRYSQTSQSNEVGEDWIRTLSRIHWHTPESKCFLKCAPETFCFPRP